MSQSEVNPFSDSIINRNIRKSTGDVEELKANGKVGVKVRVDCCCVIQGESTVKFVKGYEDSYSNDASVIWSDIM